MAWAPGKRAVVVTAESDTPTAPPTQNGGPVHTNGNGNGYPEGEGHEGSSDGGVEA